MRTPSQPLFTAVTTLALFGTVGAAAAQTTTPSNPRSYVQVVRLKPDMVSEWVALQKDEVIPAQKKAGVTSRITLVTVVGNSFEYTVITPFPSWSSMDGDAPLTRALGAAGAAALNAKIRKCIMTQTAFLATRQDELSVAAAGEALVWQTSVRRSMPGKMQEYQALYKAAVVPAIQKAKADGKIAGSVLSTRGAGALSREFTINTLYNKFADLDGPNPVTAALVAAVGRDSAAAIGAKTDLLTATSQTYVRRRVADLSF